MRLLSDKPIWMPKLNGNGEFTRPVLQVSPERLASLGVGAVISDTAGRRDALHMQVTAPHVLVRFGGYEGHPEDVKRLESWAHWIEDAERHGVSEFHLLVHEPDSIHTPYTCRTFSARLSEKHRNSCVTPAGNGGATPTLF